MPRMTLGPCVVAALAALGFTACAPSDGAGTASGGQTGTGGAQTGPGGSSSGGSAGTGGTASGGGPGTATGGQTATGGASSGGQGGGGASSGGRGGTGGAGNVGGSGSGSGGAAAGGSTGTAGAGGPAPGLGSCILPAGTNSADVQAAYAKWKTDLLTTDGANGFIRVRRPNSGDPFNTSNSEGIAYGMLAAVYMNDQTVFDQLWKYEQAHLDSKGLMHWEIKPDGTGTTPNGMGAASDGDEDMAFALVIADKKWGGKGSLADTYLNYAKKQIDLIWQHEVDHTRGDVLTPGDQFGGGQVINISYFAPAFYRVFGKVTGKVAEWNRVVDSSYKALFAALNTANKNVDNGLVPAWSTPAGVPTKPSGTDHPIHHQLDSSRTPFRIAQDYCWFGEERALTYLQKINAFYAQVGAANIVDGYNLDGTVFNGASLHLAAFVGPAGVGAMATPQHAALRDQARAAIATPPGLLGGSLYYNESWTVLSLLMMNGQYLNLAN